MARRDEFQRCADKLSYGGLADDFDSALKEVLELYKEAGFEDGDERFSINIALLFLERMGSFDPVDRYYFKAHAATLVSLEGRSRRPHELTVEYIDGRLRDFGG